MMNTTTAVQYRNTLMANTTTAVQYRKALMAKPPGQYNIVNNVW